MPLPRDGDVGPGAAGSAVLPVRPALPPALPRVRHPGTGLTSGGDGEISEENPGAAGRARTAPAGPGTPQRPVSAPGRRHACPRILDSPHARLPAFPTVGPALPSLLPSCATSRVPPHACPSGRVPAPFSALRRCGALRGRAVRSGKQSGAGPGRGKGAGGGGAPLTAPRRRPPRSTAPRARPRPLASF